MNGLFTGSEGTLGFVTEATLKLAHIPEETGVGVATFATMRDAAKAAIQVIHQGIPVGAVEILDDVQMDVINRMGGTGREWKVLPTLFFKFSGTHVGVMDDINGVCRIVQAHGGSDFEFEHDKTKQIALWSARKEALWSMMCLRTSGNEVWSTDVAVPLSKVPDLVGKLASWPPVARHRLMTLTCCAEISKKDLQELGLFGSMLGHIGDGNFHETILFNGDREREMVTKCVHDMVHRALDMEGTCTVSLLRITNCSIANKRRPGRTWSGTRKEAIPRGGGWERFAACNADHQDRTGSPLADEPGKDPGSLSDSQRNPRIYWRINSISVAFMAFMALPRVVT